MQPYNPYAPPVSAPPMALALLPHPANLELRMTLRGHPDELRQNVGYLLESSGWTLIWDPGAWSGLATKGNKVLNVLLGAFAMYHELRFAFQALPDGTTGLTLYRQGSGCMGGLIGVYKVKQAFRVTSEQLHQELGRRGLVVATQSR